ncbi:hypothetical protein [Saccharopolyspora shandongensis]|uniref:hypothetical protein n=1 Tax=Saccharopolyspora shandongensis TaxID=418495 RepID=UPI0033D84991
MRLLAPAEIPPGTGELNGPTGFGQPVLRRYERDLPYSTEEYLNLLQTYSGHRALPPTVRNGLLECIGNLIDERHGGRITKRYLTELRVVHRTG